MYVYYVSVCMFVCVYIFQESSCDLDLNTFQWLERTMLRHDASIARCLREAERLAVEDFEWRTDDKSGADDRWLHFYLMAKCSEKRDDTIEHTLELYQRVSYPFIHVMYVKFRVRRHFDS